MSEQKKLNLDQQFTRAQTWIKRGVGLALLIVVAAMIIEVFLKMLGVSVNWSLPAWSQQNGIVIAALAYALRG